MALDMSGTQSVDAGPSVMAVAPPNIPSQPPAANLSAITALTGDMQPNIPRPAGTPSVWKEVAMGALFGLAGSAGAKHFGAGLAGGARGALIEEPQVQEQRAAAEQQLRFESGKAADDHIVALAQARAADAATEAHKLQLDTYKANIDAFNTAMGIKPTLTLSAENEQDMHAQAVGGLSTLAQRNGGLIPGLTTVNSPISARDPKETIDVYAKPTAEQLQDNPSGYQNLVNIASIINTGSPISAEQWRTGNFTMKTGSPETSGMSMLSQQREGQAQMVLAAQQRLYGVPEVSASAAQNAATSARLKQQLDTYANRRDAQQSVVQLLQQQLKTFDSAAKDASDKASAAAAQAEVQKQTALFNTPQGRAAYAKTLQQTINAKYQNLADHQKQLFSTGRDPETGETLNLSNAPDEMLIDPNTHQPVPTSMLQTIKPTMQERNRADFASSVLHSLDQIDALKDAGKLPNGPLSGVTKRMLTKAGMADKDAQEALNFISFAQSAATGAHVGGRFNEAILQKMHDMIGLNMNTDQFEGAEDSIRSVMGQYAEHGGLETVGQYKQGLIGSVKSYQGKPYKVAGLDRNGNAVLVPLQSGVR